MSKTVFSIIIIGSMLLFAYPATAQAQSNTKNSLEKMKTDVYRFGTGEKAKVVVKLNNGTTLKGYIVQTGDEGFDLADSKTKKTTAISYQDVSQIKKSGMSTMAKVLIGVGVGAAIAVVVIAVAARNLDPFPNGIGIGRPR